MASLRAELCNHGIIEGTHTPVGFFDLPWEIRGAIYEKILLKEDLELYRSDYSSKGCTNIFVLNKRTRAEALYVLRNTEHTITFNVDESGMFRSMLDCGKPAFFKAQERPFRHTSGERKYTELQLLRFRCIQLKVSYKTWPDPLLRIAAIQQRVNQLLCVLRRSTDLSKLRLSVQAQEMSSVNQRSPDVYIRDIIAPTDIFAVFDSLEPILWFAKEKGIEVTIDTAQTWHQPKSGCSSWYNCEQIDHLVTKADPVAEMLSNAWASCRSRTRESEVPLWHEPLTREVLDLEATIREESLMKKLMDYRIIPECRTCFGLFASQGELRCHVETSDHSLSFKPRQEYKVWANHIIPEPWNPIHTCLTCGLRFPRKYLLREHFEKHGHERWSIIPRYVDLDGRRRRNMNCNQRYWYWRPCKAKHCCGGAITEKRKPPLSYICGDGRPWNTINDDVPSGIGDFDGADAGQDWEH